MKQVSETPLRVEEKARRKEGQVREKTPLTRELLYQEYVVKGLSIPEIAEKTGWGQTTIHRRMRSEGIRIRRREESVRWHFQRELERVRQCIRPDVRELLKRLERDQNVERTKDGRIRLQSQPREVKERFKEEVLRLQEIGEWCYPTIAKALGIPNSTVNAWLHPFQVEVIRRWQREHKEKVKEYTERRWRKARKDLIHELGGRCQRDGVSDARAFHFHELKKAPEDKGRGFWRGKWGKLWMRYRKTKYRREVLRLIQENAILLCAGCHNEITAKENRLGRRLLREEILRVTPSD